MFDVHCHMLPGIDDGSKDVAMSLEMIALSAKQAFRESYSHRISMLT